MIKDIAHNIMQVSEHPELITIFFESCFLAVLTIVMSYSINRLGRHLEAKIILKNSWNYIVLTSLRQPAQLLTWVLGLSYCFEIANIAFNLESLRALPTLRTIVTIFSIFWYLMNVVNRMEAKWALSVHEENSKLDINTIGAIIKLLKVIIFIIFGLITLETLGFSISGVLAFGSIGSAGVTFAAKDLLANFFGALMIYLDKPFKEGDSIKIDAKGVEGVVEKIGLRCTIIRNPDKSPIYVPNSIFATTMIENPSRMSHKRIKEQIILRHEDFNVAGLITSEIYDYLRRNSKIDLKLDVLVFITEVNYQGICVEISAFTKSIDGKTSAHVTNDLMLAIAKIIDANGAKFAYKDAGIK